MNFLNLYKRLAFSIMEALDFKANMNLNKIIKENKFGTPVFITDDWTVLKLGEFYRYVNHDCKLVSTGFGIEAGLIKNKDCLLATPSAIKLCRKRYKDFFYKTLNKK